MGKGSFKELKFSLWGGAQKGLSPSSSRLSVTFILVVFKAINSNLLACHKLLICGHLFFYQRQCCWKPPWTCSLYLMHTAGLDSALRGAASTC